jgi:peptide/nickel transport system substrate-binding protein
VPRYTRTALACAGALALVAAAGCGSSDSPAPEASSSETTVLEPEGAPVDGGALAVAIQNDVTGWNPTADQWGQAASFAGSSMMEALTTRNAKGEAEPWLATEWQPNDDYTSWTLTLREGVTFHNGQPFDAAAVKANIDDVLASPLTGIALAGAVEGAEVVGDQVRIDLGESWASFPTSFLAGPNAWMRAPAMIEAAKAGPTDPIGTGPFKFESWEPGAALKLVRNPDYWREGEPHLEKLEFVPVADDLSRVNALESGDVDMMITTSAQDANDSSDDYTVIKDWDTETTLLVVNTRETAGGKPNPMSNEHARKAVAHATDAQVIADLVGEDLEVPTSPFAQSTPWYDASSGEAQPVYDIEKAKQEVEAYKADTGESTLSVQLLGPNEANTTRLLQALDQQWAEAGIETEIVVQEHSAYSLQGVQGNFQLTYGPIFSAPDPDQNYHFWSEQSVAEDGAIGINFSAFATPSTQEALDTGRGTADFETRKQAYADLIVEQNEAGINVWLFFTPYSLVASERVHGLQSFADLPWGNYQPKPWWGSVWVSG